MHCRQKTKLSGRSGARRRKRDRKLFRKPRFSHGPFFSLSLFFTSSSLHPLLRHTMKSMQFDLGLFPTFPSLFTPRFDRSRVSSSPSVSRSLFLSVLVSRSLFLSVARALCANWYYGGTPLESESRPCMYLRALHISARLCASACACIHTHTYTRSRERDRGC